MQSVGTPPQISSLVRYEFQNAVWFDVWRRSNGQLHGLSQTDAQTGLAAFELDLERGLWKMAHPDWEGVIARAERITLARTPRSGARALDILHIATALQVAVSEFLTFDIHQLKIAEAEGLALSL